MIILLTGATGFIGRRLAKALAEAGHEVVCVVRDAKRSSLRGDRFRYIEADFTRSLDPAEWMSRVAGADAVINAVGILRENGAQTFEALHVRAPKALFTACATAGVRLVIQISALGADAHASSRYHVSKKTADDFLSVLAVPFVIVQPSLVYGPGGTSARLFTGLASLPLIPLPGGGNQQVQPIYIDDLVESVVALLGEPDFRNRRVPLVGPQALSLRDFLGSLRRALGEKEARFVAVPMTAVRAAAYLGGFLPGVLLDRETLQMLLRGNTASAEATRRLLGRNPRPVSSFIDTETRHETRAAAKLAWLLPLLRLSIALVWIVTGIVSLGVYPIESSYELLARVGVPAMVAPLLLYGAALLDLAFGIAMVIGAWRRPLYLAQIALILFYSVVIAWKLPEFWAHPYGPMLKNLPLLIGIWILYELEE